MIRLCGALSTWGGGIPPPAAEASSDAGAHMSTTAKLWVGRASALPA